MKEKRITAISVILLIIPWTIFAVRSNAWALESPAAELVIGGYAAFMILSGIFTIGAYGKEAARNSLMRVCAVINGLYAVVGAAVIVMMWV